MFYVSTLALVATLALATPVPESQLEERAGQFKFYQLPTQLSGICDLAPGPDGALWGEEILINQIAHLDPESGKVTEYKIPFTTGLSNVTVPGVSQAIQDRLAFSCAIRPGRDGNMYATNGVRDQLVQINTKTKAIRVFQSPPDPTGNLFPFNDLYSSHDGMYVTKTTGNQLQFFNFSTESFTNYEIPTPLALPLGVFVASDNKAYGCELLANQIFIFDPKTKKITEVPLPTPLQSPAVVRSEKAGWIYFMLFTGNGMGRINMKTHAIELYHTDQLGGLGGVDTGPVSDGAVWMSFLTSTNALARLDTKSLTFSYVPFPDTFAAYGINGLPGNFPPYLDIGVNYLPGNYLWFGSISRNAIGRYSL